MLNLQPFVFRRPDVMPSKVPTRALWEFVRERIARQIAKAITEPPAPAPKRRRTDETREALKLTLEKLFQWTKTKKQRKDAPADDPALTEMEWRDFWGEYHHTAESSAEASHTCERPETSIHAYNFAPQF